MLKPNIYIVSTPIGNLSDISLRAIEILRSVNLIACENTRNVQKLLGKFDIKTKLMCYNDFSSDLERKKIFNAIEEGNSVALVSDAGTPLISDPGYKLIKEAMDLNIGIDIAPGVSAPIAALTLSGMPSDKFIFTGFLPKTSFKRLKLFKELDSLNYTLIFFESPNRIKASIEDLYNYYGDVEIAIVREITKIYQEVIRGRVLSVIEKLKTREIKGEIVLLIGGNREKNITEEEVISILEKLILSHSAKDAVTIFMEEYTHSYSRREIYEMVNKLKLT